MAIGAELSTTSGRDFGPPPFPAYRDACESIRGEQPSSMGNNGFDRPSPEFQSPQQGGTGGPGGATQPMVYAHTSHRDVSSALDCRGTEPSSRQLLLSGQFQPVL